MTDEKYILKEDVTMRKFLNAKASDLTVGGTILFTVVIYAICILWLPAIGAFVVFKDWFCNKIHSLKNHLSAKNES